MLHTKVDGINPMFEPYLMVHYHPTRNECIVQVVAADGSRYSNAACDAISTHVTTIAHPMCDASGRYRGSIQELQAAATAEAILQCPTLNVEFKPEELSPTCNVV